MTGQRFTRHNQSKSIPLLYVVFEQIDQLPVNLSTSFPYIACPLSIYYFDSSSANNPSQNLVFFFKRIKISFQHLAAMDHLIVDGGWLLQTKVVRDESIEPQLCGGGDCKGLMAATS